MDFWTRIERAWIISHFEAATGPKTGDYPRSWNGCPKIHARWADADAPGNSFFVDVVVWLHAEKAPAVNIYSIWVKRPKRRHEWRFAFEKN